MRRIVLILFLVGIVSGAMLQLKEDFDLDCPKQEMIVTALVIGGLGASIVGGKQNLLKFIHCTLKKLKPTFVLRATLSHFTCMRGLETEKALCFSSFNFLFFSLFGRFGARIVF